MCKSKCVRNSKRHVIAKYVSCDDITEDISSQLRLFAEDCLLYRTIKSEQNSILLQRDLDTLSLWAKVWQMRFNLNKCTIIRCTRSHNPIIINYSLHGFTLSATTNICILELC